MAVLPFLKADLRFSLWKVVRSLWQMSKALPDVFVIALLLAGWMFYQSQQHRQRMSFLQQPLINDFVLVDYYQIDPGSDPMFRYVPIKVTAIDEHKIEFVRGNYGHTKAVGIIEHVKFDAALNYNFFAQQPKRVSKAEFTRWVEEGIVYDMARPEKIYIDGWIVLRPTEVVEASKRNHRYLQQQGLSS